MIFHGPISPAGHPPIYKDRFCTQATQHTELNWDLETNQSMLSEDELIRENEITLRCENF